MKKEYVTIEIEKGGHPEYLEIVKQMANIHASKSNDYADGSDPLRNLKLSEHLKMLPAWKSVIVRLLDKMSRLGNAFTGKLLKHESVEDTFIDLANYAILGLILYREAGRNAKKKN